MPQGIKVRMPDGSVQTFDSMEAAAAAVRAAQPPQEGLIGQGLRQMWDQTPMMGGIGKLLGVKNPLDYAQEGGGGRALISDLLRAVSSVAPLAIPGAGPAAMAGRAALGILPNLLARGVEDGDTSGLGSEAMIQGGLEGASLALPGLAKLMTKPAIRLGGVVSGARSHIMGRGGETAVDKWDEVVDSLARLSDNPLPSGRRVTPNAPVPLIQEGRRVANQRIKDAAANATGGVNVPEALYEGAAKHITEQVRPRADMPLEAERAAIAEAVQRIGQNIASVQPGGLRNQEAFFANPPEIQRILTSRLEQRPIPPGVSNAVTQLGRIAGRNPFDRNVDEAWDTAKGLGETVRRRRAAQSAGRFVEGQGSDALAAAQHKELQARIKAADPTGEIARAMQQYNDVMNAWGFQKAVRRDPAILPMRGATGHTIGAALGGLTGAVFGGPGGAALGAAGGTLAPLALAPENIYRLLVSAPRTAGKLIGPAGRIAGVHLREPEE